MTKMMEVYTEIRNCSNIFQYAYGDRFVETHIAKYLPPHDKMGVAREIFKICFVKDDDGQYYLRTGLINPLKRIFFINLYCVDFKIDLKEDGDYCFDFVMNTDFFDELIAEIGNDEYYEYSCCIDDYIDYKMKEYYASIASSKVDKSFASLIEKINSIIPDNIDKEQYGKFIKKVVESTDDDNIVKNVLEYRDGADG